MTEVPVLVGGRQRLALVAREADPPPRLLRHRAPMAALPQQTVYGLQLGPALLAGDLSGR